MGYFQAHLPTPHTECSAVFDRTHSTIPPLSPWPTLPIHPDSPGWKKVLKGKSLADVEEVKQKMAEALKTSKLRSSETALSSGKVSIGVLYQMESTLMSTLKVMEV